MVWCPQERIIGPSPSKTELSGGWPSCVMSQGQRGEAAGRWSTLPGEAKESHGALLETHIPVLPQTPTPTVPSEWPPAPGLASYHSVLSLEGSCKCMYSAHPAMLLEMTAFGGFVRGEGLSAPGKCRRPRSFHVTSWTLISGAAPGGRRQTQVPALEPMVWRKRSP